MRTLVFYPHKLYPATTGSNQRGLSILKALKTLQHEVTLFSANMPSEAPWDRSSVEGLKREYQVDVQIHHPTPADLKYGDTIAWNDIRPDQWGYFAAPGLKRAFVRYARHFRPNAVIINYSSYGNLVDHAIFDGKLKVLETLDLYSLNVQMQKILFRHLPPSPVHPDDTPRFLLDDHFFQNLDFKVWPEEYRMFDHFDASITVSPAETDFLRQNTQHTIPYLIPITAPIIDAGNSHSGNPLFLAALNMMNVQGYLYLARRILPLIRSACPEFTLDVVGACCRYVQPVDGINLRGYVPNMIDAYRESAFAICPLIGGTGQQVKIVEAMASGLPVVVHRNVAASSPVIHGKTGFVASNPSQFADYCCRLYHDRDLCRRMGIAARDRIRKDWSQDILVSQLADLLKLRPSPARAASRKRPVHRRQPPVSACSIIIDIRQGHHANLERTLESLIRLTRSPYEVILCGATRPRLNLSTSESNLLRQLAPERVSHPHTAVNRIRGKFLAILAPGDILFPAALETVEATFSRHPSVKWLQGRPAFCDGEGRLTWIMETPPDSEEFPGMNLRRSALFWHTNAWRQVLQHLPAKGPISLASAQFTLLAQSHWRPTPVDALLGATISDHGHQQTPIMIPTRGPVLSAGQDATQFLNNQLASFERNDNLLYIQQLQSRMEATPRPQAMLLQSFYVRMLQCRWESWSGTPERPHRIALFGAGTHTHWLLSVIRQSKGPRIIAILDDFARPGTRLEGIPVHKAYEYDISQIDAIVPSSDTHQTRFSDRCRELFGSRVPLWLLYEGLPPGPYPKLTTPSSEDTQ